MHTIKKVKVDPEWEMLHLGPYIFPEKNESLTEGEVVVGYIGEEQWKGTARSILLNDKFLCWYLELPKED